MKAIEKGRQIGKDYRAIKKCEPYILVNDKPFYKPNFILFVIERMQAEQFFDFQSILETAQQNEIT
jgi:hypothetical protein